MSASAAASPSAWAPLRIAAYRSLWLALLVANIGTWMQTVGAQWLLVAQSGSDTLVALVQTASTLPIVLFALPSGALADTLDRRQMLIAVQCFLAGVGAVLTVLTLAGRMPAALLLTLTFVLGAGQALTTPAWQALIPDLVPRSQLANSSALGAVGLNLARAVGPAVAGVLIAQSGVGVVFGLNTLAFVLFAVVLWRWRPPAADYADAPERFAAAVRAGERYVRHSPVVRRILLRAGLFLVPGSALWALLPLVAGHRLGLGPGGYGLLLAAVGVGAVAGALLLPRLRASWSVNRLLMIACVVFTLIFAVLALVRSEVAAVVALVPAGVAWILIFSNVNAALQLFLPYWVRARGLAIYQMVCAGAQAAGALAWGALSDAVGLEVTYLAAAVVMAAGVLTLRRWPMPDTAGMNREPAVYWPEPHLLLVPSDDDGPILVTVSYHVATANEEAFVAAMEAVRLGRLETGAVRWGLFRDGEEPSRFVEAYLVPRWEEHLRQHTGRLTGVDREAEEYAESLTDGPGQATHLFSAR
ncbi:MFS transporter [Actinoplanes sp. KI2]|uniref:MFS transporter n=1 Tax=Actinoplanes sp. KI2 TaxID=2983315 RepID=UPI0021D5D547|nr:MFS transporter [Actinoplanes sp. KI2]MCU7730957.1 MFS transporter [Actinoplanes sp. KI2]